jgi:hypothetical protein
MNIPVDTYILQPSTLCNIQICAPIYFIHFWPPILLLLLLLLRLLALLLL